MERGGGMRGDGEEAVMRDDGEEAVLGGDTMVS